MISKPRVLILWAKPTATNLGIRALAEGTVALCRSAWPDCEVVLHDHDTMGTPLGKSPILSDIGRRNGFIKNLASAFDIVIDTCSGDSFTDIYGLRRLLVMTYAHRAIKKSGTPLMISPQTLGPFNTRLGRYVGKQSLLKATLVFARDSESAAFSTALGRHPDGVSSDVVWMLSQPKVTLPADVVLNVSGLLWSENPHVDFNIYRELCFRFVDEAQRRGRDITLLAHVLKSSISSESDVDAVEDLAKIIGPRRGVSTFIPNSLGHVRSLMAGSNVVVGARMHACLNSLSVGTPAIPWAYSRKFAPLLKDINWPHVQDLRTAGDHVEETLRLIEMVDLRREVDSCAAVAREGFNPIILSMRESLESHMVGRR